jgi:hypothetical protein
MAVWPYNTQRWLRLRRMKLQVNPLCELCLKQKLIVPAVAVDHIIAVSRHQAVRLIQRSTGLCPAALLAIIGRLVSNNLVPSLRLKAATCAATRWILDTLGTQALRCVTVADYHPFHGAERSC